jgi:hypothetical protein
MPTDCLKWNKRAINQACDTMGLRNAIIYGAEASWMLSARPKLARRTKGVQGTNPETLEIPRFTGDDSQSMNGRSGGDHSICNQVI